MDVRARQTRKVTSANDFAKRPQSPARQAGSTGTRSLLESAGRLLATKGKALVFDYTETDEVRKYKVFCTPESNSYRICVVRNLWSTWAVERYLTDDYEAFPVDLDLDLLHSEMHQRGLEFSKESLPDGTIVLLGKESAAVVLAAWLAWHLSTARRARAARNGVWL